MRSTPHASPPPSLSRTQERLAVGALTAAAFVIAVNVNLVGPLLGFIGEDPLYGAEPDLARLSDLVWTTHAAAAVASLLLGPLVDRFGRRPPMILGVALLALSLAAHPFAPSHAALLGLRVLSGFGGGLAYMSASAAVADLVPYQRRGAAMGVFSAGLFLATPLGLPVAVEIARTGDEAWRWAFGGLAVPALLGIAGICALLPRGLGRAASGVTQLQVLREPHVVAALLSTMLYTGAFFTVVQYTPSWLDRSGILAKEQQSPMWIVLGVGTLLGLLVLARVADRIGKRTLVLATSAGAAICVALLVRVEGIAGLGAVGMPLAVLAAARTAALQALMSEIVEPRMRGTLMGLRSAAVTGGQALFAKAGGAVFDERGFHVLAYVCTAAMVVSYLLVRYGMRVRL